MGAVTLSRKHGGRSPGPSPTGGFDAFRRVVVEGIASGPHPGFFLLGPLWLCQPQDPDTILNFSHTGDNQYRWR